MNAIGESATTLYNSIDYYAEFANGKTYAFEVKVRDLKNYKTVILSTNKVEALKNEVEKHNLNGAYYACFYEDGRKVLFFDVINTQPISREFKMIPKTTAGDDNNLVEREVYHYNIKDGISMVLKNNRYNYANDKKNTKEKTQLP
jgi:hypothetical protein